MNEEDLLKYGITGCRLSTANVLRSKPYDIFMIILIILYTLLIFLFFGFEDTFFSGDNVMIFYIIELSILGIFCVEITVHIIAFTMLYLRDWWNLFDILIIIISLIFVFLDIFVDNDQLSGFLKIRGIFRLLRIFLLIRKLSQLKEKRDIQKRKVLLMGFDIRSPLERVLEILNTLRDQLDVDETKVINELNYCIKIISSN